MCGYMRLARLLGNAVLGSDYAALVLYAGVRVGEGFIAYGLRALRSVTCGSCSGTGRWYSDG